MNQDGFGFLGSEFVGGEAAPLPRGEPRSVLTVKDGAKGGRGCRSLAAPSEGMGRFPDFPEIPVFSKESPDTEDRQLHALGRRPSRLYEQLCSCSLQLANGLNVRFLSSDMFGWTA